MKPGMDPKNAEYCKTYRQKNLKKIRKKDKQRKKFEREHEKYLNPEKYEETKRKDRERKRQAKKRKLAEEEMDEEPPSLEIPDSSFKHKQTMYRSLSKANKALPQSPSKRDEIVSNLVKKYEIKVNLKETGKGRKATSLTEEEENWIVSL